MHRPALLRVLATCTGLALLTGCASLAQPTDDAWSQGGNELDSPVAPSPTDVREHSGTIDVPMTAKIAPPAPAEPEPSEEPTPGPVAPPEKSAPTVAEAAPVPTTEPKSRDEPSRTGSRTPVPSPAPTPSKTPETSPPASYQPASSSPVKQAGVTNASALVPTDPNTRHGDGAVIENIRLTGDVVLTGDNQTLRNVRVDGELIIRGSGTSIEDSSVGALSISGAADVSIRRVDVFGHSGKDGIHVTSDSGRVTNLLIEGTRVHSPQVTASSHYDGIQVRGVDGLTLRGNSFELGPYKRQFTAAIFLENANGGNTNVTIEGNYLDGGGYSVYLGGKNIRFVNNTFGSSAGFGILYPNSDMSSVTTSGNIGPDGKPLKL